jgi:hypothetical protein
MPWLSAAAPLVLVGCLLEPSHGDLFRKHSSGAENGKEVRLAT